MFMMKISFGIFAALFLTFLLRADVESVTHWGENHHDFRKRMDVVHTPGLCDPSATKATDELSLADGVVWTLPEKMDAVLQNAVQDFEDFLKVSMETGERKKEKGKRKKCGEVALVLDSGVGVRTSRIEVSDADVRIVAADSRAAAQALFHLEDLMNLRRGPFLKKGTETRRMKFSPRMSHSGYSLDRFPDTYLAQMAHHGLDAALVFVRDIDRAKALGKTDIADIIRRAKDWGIDTYLYSYIAAYAHPDDPKAKEVFEKTYGRVAAAYPEAKGIVFVGESCQFPSKDPRVWGHEESLDGVKRPAGETRPAAGWFPCKDYPDWLRAVKAAIDAKSPGMEIVFWSYNWGKQPREPRLELIDALPKDVTLMATFEMFEDYRKRNGFHARTEDYSLSFAGPGQYFVSEAEEAKKVGLRLYSMANTSGKTWDFGMAPYEPAPFQWKRRWDAVNAAQVTWGLSGLMENHHYGWSPSFVAELAKEAYTDGGLPFDEHLRKIAARDFGEANAETAVAVWEDWSEAIRDQTTGAINQYTFLRIGPAYPFAFGAPPLDGKDFPVPEIAPESSGMFVMNYPVWDGPGDLQGFTDRDDEIGLEIELLDSAATAYLRGADRFRAMAAELRGFQRERAIRMADLGAYMGRTLLTGRHIKEGMRAMRQGGDMAKLREIAVREYANTLAARELVARDSQLGWEPTMDYQGSVEQIDWKLSLMRRIYRLDNYRLDNDGKADL